LFNNVDIKVLHIEPTTVCNAACPQCSREDPNYYVDSEHRAELSLNQVKSIVNDDFIRTLDKMFMCGNFGDPAAAQDCLKILIQKLYWD
jgi:MoaA/NifB/PqqE/SkfB family radical SAM enzyme